jgi:hypothetical protein
MTRIPAILFLLLASSFYVQAQNRSGWASARELGLRGAVRTVVSKCSEGSMNTETRFKYEYARDGKLMAITAPQFKQWDCIISSPTSYKITRRNSRGDVTEAALFVSGELERKERYEYEYDGVGNWIRVATLVMREYEMAGGSWKAGEWRALHVCTRTIDYYPSAAT